MLINNLQLGIYFFPELNIKIGHTMGNRNNIKNESFYNKRILRLTKTYAFSILAQKCFTSLSDYGDNT